MQMNGQLHAPISLLEGKQPPSSVHSYTAGLDAVH
jgi:hypothetical protein